MKIEGNDEKIWNIVKVGNKIIMSVYLLIILLVILISVL